MRVFRWSRSEACCAGVVGGWVEDEGVAIDCDGAGAGVGEGYVRLAWLGRALLALAGKVEVDIVKGQER